MPKIVSRDQWLAERKELLAHEKDVTKHYDQVNAAKRTRLAIRLVGYRACFADVPRCEAVELRRHALLSVADLAEGQFPRAWEGRQLAYLERSTARSFLDLQWTPDPAAPAP